MSERGYSSDDTQVSEAEAPELSESAGAQAVAEGASEAVDPPPASTEVGAPAPPLDESAATPDRSGPAGAVSGVAADRPELLVAGAFVGGLVLALLLKKVAGGDG
jgi:hypothetical protein